MAYLSEYCQAANEVLALPELLEWILLKLPAKEILLAKRVSRTWRNLIKSSPKLQQVLSIRRPGNPEVWIYRYHKQTQRPVGRLEILLACTTGTYNIAISVLEERSRDVKIQDQGGRVLPATPNGLLIDTECKSLQMYEETISWRCARGQYAKLRWSEKSTNGSCREMYLCRPPAKVVIITLAHSSCKRVVIRNVNGVKYGEILDHIKEAQGGEIVSSPSRALVQLQDVVFPSNAELKDAMEQMTDYRKSIEKEGKT